MSSFRALLFTTFFPSVEYHDYLYASRFAHAYEWHRRHVQVLSHAAPPPTWVLKAPVLVPGAYADRPAVRPDDWSGLAPLTAPTAPAMEIADGFSDEGGHQLKPELDIAPVQLDVPDAGDLLVLDDEDDVPLRPQDVDRQLMRTARLAALDPDDGIAL